MNVFLVKITNKENVDKVLNKQFFTHLDIYNFENEIKINDPVFLYFSGDRAKINWEQGLIGFGRILKGPYDKGYNPTKKRYFKVDIAPESVLEHPLSPKFTKLHPKYQNELFDVPYVGANHFPNQAIAKTSGKSAEALFHLFEDIMPGSTANLNYAFLNKKSSGSIKDEFRDFLLKKNKASTVSSYVNALDQIPEYLSSINVKCPFVWDENVDFQALEDAVKFVKGESLKENGGKLSAYNPKSHWNNGWFFSGVNNYKIFLENSKLKSDKSSLIPPPATSITKPFLLLAGISGTGKTRFVRAQASRSNGFSAEDNLKPDNYELVSVRPDWHEPSDLLGYISRINGEKYIPTSFLTFLIKAWNEIFSNNGSISDPGESTRPFWLCLDEMNLAPVEQYFADYLSILESRKFNDDCYSSLPLISDNLDLVRESLSATEDEKLMEAYANNELWDAFAQNKGIPIPPNLIVAGTVNMDETTHGFSRKVIDRALTLDFQEFFPNKFDEFFLPEKEPKIIGFPMSSHISSENDLIDALADPNGRKSIKFLSLVNNKLKSTPFELAFRALNDLLLSVKCFKPENDNMLVAVWDDFLMQKVLPRIEGDADKLWYTGEEDSGLLYDLKEIIKNEFSEYMEDDDGRLMRPDLLNQKTDGSEAPDCSCKSLDKIEWMQERLELNQYTSFWA